MIDEQERRHQLATALSEMAKPMYEGPNGFTAVVAHSVYLNGFPSQWRGPVLAVYCFDEEDELRVEPRWLTPTGVGVHRGPMSRVQDLRNGITPENLTWFSDNQIPFDRWRELAIQNTR